MKLKEKTNKKFLEFFEKMAKMYQGKEFELSYSDIQRETGTASVTMKRAIQSLQENGIVDVKPGRNSRYGKFKYLKQMELPSPENNQESAVDLDKSNSSSEIPIKTFGDIDELHSFIDNLRRRVRSQEMAIALLQDRLAEIEDKLYKR